MPAVVRLMVLSPGLVLAKEMAERRLEAMKGSAGVPAWPAVRTGLLLSAKLATLRTAGARRSSSASRRGRNRAGTLRMVWGVRVKRRRIQVRTVMGNLLPKRGGL